MSSTTKAIPELQKNGVQHVMGAGEKGLACQVSASFLLAGAAPHTITIANLVGLDGEPFRPMRDANYIPHVVGDSAAEVDLGSRNANTFDLVNGSAADEVSIIIFGAYEGMLR